MASYLQQNGRCMEHKSGNNILIYLRDVITHLRFSYMDQKQRDQYDDLIWINIIDDRENLLIVRKGMSVSDVIYILITLNLIIF